MQTNSQATKPVTTHKEIRAESFVLVNSKGKCRAELSTINDEDAVFVLFDGKGRLRLTLRGGAREATLSIFGEDARQVTEKVVIGWNCGDQTPFVQVYDRNEEGEITAVRNLAAAADDADEAETAPRVVADDLDSFSNIAALTGEKICELLKHPACPAALAEGFASFLADLSNKHGSTALAFERSFGALALEAAVGAES